MIKDWKWYNVKVYFPAELGLSAFIHHDAIQGISPKHALNRAYWNWDQAELIELV